MSLVTLLENMKANGPHFRDAASRGNLAVLKSMLGPAWRGFVKQDAKGSGESALPVSHEVHFDWQYKRDQPEMAKLYEAAKVSQWNAAKDIDWSIDVDPERTAVELSARDHRVQYVRKLTEEKGSPVASWSRMSMRA